MPLIFEGRPSLVALATRMKRDKVTGSIRPVVAQSDDQPGRPAVYFMAYGVFEGDALIAFYGLRRNGQILGGVRNTPTHYWWCVYAEVRLATAEEVALLDNDQP